MCAPMLVSRVTFLVCNIGAQLSESVRRSLETCSLSKCNADILQDKIKDNQQDLSVIIPDLASMAAELVRDLDPQVRPDLAAIVA